VESGFIQATFEHGSSKRNFYIDMQLICCFMIRSQRGYHLTNARRWISRKPYRNRLYKFSLYRKISW